jgi:hypothetical protein
VFPADTLVVMIESAAGLAGFAGIVATLRRERWTQLDRLQIQNLLSSAFSALFISILALILFHAEVDENLTWQILSGTWFVVGFLATAQNGFAYLRLGKTSDENTFSASNLFWFGTALCTLVLQIYNVLVLTAFWPVLVGISWLFALTCYSFWQLLIRHK